MLATVRRSGRWKHQRAFYAHAVHLDTFDRVSPCGYAVIVVDKTATRWVC